MARGEADLGANGRGLARSGRIPTATLRPAYSASCGRAAAATYNPKTKHYFGFADNYVPDPVIWRHDLWNDVGESPATWDHVLKAAPKLKQRGHAIGIGMSNELDSNMANFAIMLCFGGKIQDENGNGRINSKHTVEWLNFMKVALLGRDEQRHLRLDAGVDQPVPLLGRRLDDPERDLGDPHAGGRGDRRQGR